MYLACVYILAHAASRSIAIAVSFSVKLDTVQSIGVSELNTYHLAGSGH